MAPMTPSDLIFSRSPQPLYLQVAAIFRRNIQRRAWQPGSQIPPLDTLVESLGVSRATVRQAFGLLEQEGLIRRSRGAGTYVNETLPETVMLRLPKTWKETVELSNALGTVSLMESSEDVALPQDLGMACEFDTDGRFQYLRRLHVARSAPFCYTEVYLESSLYRKHPERYRSSTVAPVLDEFYGARLTHARQRMTIIEAGADSAELLKIPVSAPVAEIRRYACIGDQVVYFARLEIPSRHVEMEFDLLEPR